MSVYAAYSSGTEKYYIHYKSKLYLEYRVSSIRGDRRRQALGKISPCCRHILNGRSLSLLWALLTITLFQMYAFLKLNVTRMLLTLKTQTIIVFGDLKSKLNFF